MMLTERKLVSAFIVAGVTAISCSSTACIKGKPGESYVCNSVRDAERIYFSHYWTFRGTPRMRCELVRGELSEEYLRKVAADRKVLVYNDGVSAIEMYTFSWHDKHPRVKPIEATTVAVECQGCSGGEYLGVRSGGVYQWCTWKGKECVFRQLVPGKVGLVVEDAKKGIVGTSSSCIAAKGRTSRCVCEVDAEAGQ